MSFRLSLRKEKDTKSLQLLHACDTVKMDDYPLSVKTRGGSNMKKVISFILAFMMIFTMLPITAFAGGDGENETGQTNGENKPEGGENGTTDDKITLKITKWFVVGYEEGAQPIRDMIGSEGYSLTFYIDKVTQTGTDTTTSYELKISGFQDDGDGVWEASGSIELPAGEYYVTEKEQNISVDGFTNDNPSFSSNDGTDLSDPSNPERAIIDITQFNEMTVKNAYTPAYGNLIITKTFAGPPFNEDPDFFQHISDFQLKLKSCAYGNIVGVVSWDSESGTFTATDGSVTTNDNGFVWTLDGIRTGIYNFQEENAKPEESLHLNFFVNDATVLPGETTNADLANVYSYPSTYCVNIIKRLIGIKLEDLPTDAAVVLTPSDGGTVISVPFSRFTKIGNGQYFYSVTDSSLAAGTYSVTEMDVDVEGYNLVKTIPETIQVVAKGETQLNLKNEYTPKTGDPTITATIKFVDEDGTILQCSEVPYGGTPSYTRETPTKAPDAQYTYTFAGWTPAITEVTGDATYKATYTATVREYTITFVNDDGTVLQSSEVPYGGTPSYTQKTPTKAPDAQYTYTFAGWTPGITWVTGDTTYKATYTSAVREYTITFVNDDGKTVLQSGKLTYGETPEYKGTTPTKEPDAQYTYTFAGWTPTIAKVTEDATYTVSFSTTVNEYEIKFVDSDGKTVLQSSKLAYGETPEYKGTTPTKEPDAQYIYTFKGWTPELKDVTVNAVYTAVYSSVKQTYTITWKNDDGSLIDTTIVEYGGMPTHTNPTKPATAQYTYEFAGWDKEIAKVTGEATYTASFREIACEYTIKFVNYDGTEIYGDKVAYGELPKYEGPTPTRPATAEYTYTFKGWEPELVKVTGDATYKATFREEAKKGVYEAVSGAGSTWNEGSSDPLVFTFKRTVDDDTCFDHFAGVLVDNQARADITAKRGSTIITISAETLKTLSAGKHTLTVLFDDADPVEVTFTIAAKAAESTTPEKGTNTGDSYHPALWISLMALSLIGIGAVVMFRKKRLN